MARYQKSGGQDSPGGIYWTTVIGALLIGGVAGYMMGQSSQSNSIPPISSSVVLNDLIKADPVEKQEPVESLDNGQLDQEVQKIIEAHKGKDETQYTFPEVLSKPVEQQQETASVEVAPKKKPVPAPVAEQKIEATIIYTLQMASFRDETHARALSTKLNQKGYAARVQKAELPGAVWYRVMVGNYAEKAMAEGQLAQLKAQEKLSGLLLSIAK